MTLDEIREVEAVVDGIVEESTSIFSKEVPLTFAKKIEGIKMCSYEVSVNQHFIVNSETIVFLRCLWWLWLLWNYKSLNSTNGVSNVLGESLMLK